MFIITLTKLLKDGEKNASTYSAKAGNSEHQTGLAFDIGSVDRSFEGTDEAKWISENAHLYGFILVMKRLLTDKDFSDMKSEIALLTQKYPFVNMKYYGFRSDWSTVL